MPNRIPYIAFLLALTAFFGHSCSTKNKGGIPKDATIIKPIYSRLFLLGVLKTDTFLQLNDPSDSNRTLGTYCWGKGDETYDGVERIQSARKLILTTAVFVGMVESLHEENRILAVDNGDYVSSPRTKKHIAEGKIASVAKTGELDKEAVAKLNPDLLIGYFIDAKGKEDLQQSMRGKGKVLFFQNFLETHPLGRAEWIKVFGFLCGKPKEAMDQFAEIEEHYNSTAQRAEEAKTHPKVLINAPFSAIWDIPAGESYMSQLVEDAGGEYIWADAKGAGRIPMDIEKVYAKAGMANVWLNPGPCRDLNCLKSIDTRLSKFHPFGTKAVFNCTKTITKTGANNYWEYGVLRPDMVLLDIFTILHPELEFEHELVFFEKLK